MFSLRKAVNDAEYQKNLENLIICYEMIQYRMRKKIHAGSDNNPSLRMKNYLKWADKNVERLFAHKV